MKGSLTDVLIAVVLLFAFSIIVILAWNFFNVAQTNAPAGLDFSYAKDIMQLFDGALALLFVGLIIVALLSAFFVNSHPAFAILGILFMLCLIPITGALNNAFMSFIADSNISSAVTAFPLLIGIMSNLPAIALLMQFLVIIVIYMKNRNNQYDQFA